MNTTTSEEIEKYGYQYVINSEDQEKISRKPLIRQVIVSSCVWVSYVVSGLCQGSTTVLIPQIRREANSTEAVGEEMASWISSVHGYAGMPWVLILPALSNKIGRKYTYLFINFSVVISFISLYYSTSTTEILLCEILQGILMASQISISIIVIAEYTSPKYRGLFLTIKSATYLWGIWIANALGTFFHWRVICILGTSLSIYNCLVILSWPESPYWLAGKTRFEECAKSHRLLKGRDKDSEKELRDLIKSRKKYPKTEPLHTNCFKKVYENVKCETFYRPFLICSIILCFYHLSGKMVCTIYAIDLIKKITKSESTAYKAMLILDGITVLGTYVGSGLSKICKRRVLFLTMSSLAVMFLLVISLYLFLVNSSVLEVNNYVSIFLLTGFSLCVSSGPIMLSTSIYGELIPLKSRTLFMICSGLYYDLLLGTVLKLAPLMFRVLGLHGTFLFYGISSLILTFLAYKFVPETKDKTLIEIQNNMADECDEVEMKELSPYKAERQNLTNQK